MTISTLLDRLTAAGIRLRSIDGELRVAGNRAALDAELVAQLRLHKPALLEMVGGDRDEWWSPPQPAQAESGATAGVCIHELFEAQVARTPGAMAVILDDERLAYAELDARANQLAHHLRRHGVGREVPVGVCLEWRPELVVALLAVLKAGGVYVPLDPALPPERLAYMANDAGLAVVVTRAALAGRVPAPAAVLLDADAERIAEESDDRLASPAPSQMAYVIYTSGSTGRPKGVAVEHGPAAAHLGFMLQSLGITAGDRNLQFASASFDVSLEEVLLPLMVGATLVLRGPELWSLEEFRERVRSLGITVVNLSPAYWQAIASLVGEEEDALPGVRLLIVGGDVLPPAAARTGGATRLMNCYGPTETIITATSFEVPADFAGTRVPIGRPLPGHAAYVLDAFGAPVPPGVAGELYLGGLTARGYLGRPGLTAERFVPDPFGGDGRRMYRTGDRARWNTRGELEFLGRTDFQVKIRGFRIELGEIEARLLEHPRVREAVVVAREDVPGDKRLVAYVVAGEEAGADALRAHLGERLPEYMVPAAFVRLDALPLNTNGKVDRKALPAPEGDAFTTRGYEAPAGEVEEALAAIWSKLLGVERVGRRDHFFERGGHSLLAVQVISRVRQTLGVEVTLGDLFARPVLADFARGLESAARAELPPIQPVERSGALPLSFAQQRLWFLEQLGSGGATYHIPTRIRLRGELDRAALARALDRIVARHEALRTTFVEVDGVAVQRIAPADVGFHLREHDLRGDADAGAELRRRMAEEADAPFDLEHGPLIRGQLLRLADDDHVLLITMHHIVSDGWSMGVFSRELGVLYAAFQRGEPDPLPPLPVQYADYAVWQRRWMEGEVLRAQSEYWTRTLAGAPELLELPTDHARPARQDHAGGVVGMELDAELTAGLKALSQRHGATLFMTLLAGWAAVLSRLSGQEDVVIGTPTANRGRSEIEGLIGFFVNTLALRVELGGSPTVAELLERVRERVLGAQQHQDIPFEQVVELVQPARSLAHTPLFQVMLAWQNTPEPELELPGLAQRPTSSNRPTGSTGAPREATAKFDLLLTLSEHDGRIAGSLTYATALFEAATIERYLGYLRAVLQAMVADERRAVDALPLLSGHERRRVLGAWNATETRLPANRCIHQLFEAHAERTPGATAVVSGGEQLTYAELNARANRLAHHLRALGVGPDVRVALVMARSTELVEAELAVLKAGGAYVPLDAEYPDERLREMIGDSRPAVLLTRGEWAERFAGLAARVVAVDADASGWASRPDTNPAVEGVTPEHLAYVMYTSGSTGRPKGVMVTHQGVVRLVVNNGYAEFGPHDRVAFAANPAFDATTMEVWAPLVNGGRIVVIPQGTLLDPQALARVLEDQGVTTLFITTAIFNQYASVIPAALARVRHLLTGGESGDPGAFARVLAEGAHGRLIHCYGPTEATTFAVTHPVEHVAGGARTIPLGRPIGNTRIYLLNGALEPVPVGAPGEMYIGGQGVARGYQGRPALTAERFVPDPFSGEPGARLYRTGDLGRWRPDGMIEFLGRTDHQVKVRGFRIEPGEIEARLLEHPEVREAVVLAREDAPGEKRLVAYVVGGEAARAEVLRAHLSASLPEYMVPAAYVRLDAFPLTPNGKIDRRALPAPEGGAYVTRGYEAPRGETEEALAGIWAEVLGVERVGRGDNFFELGGHSLLAVQVVSRVRQAMRVEIALADLFSHPTVESLAARVCAGEGAAPADRAIGIRTTGSRAPLFFVYEGTGSTAYAQVLHPHIDAEVPVYALPAPPASQPTPRTIEAMATRLVRLIREVQPSGPYRVAGWSLGGVLAYEIASQLIGQDEAVEFVGMLDSYAPGGSGTGPVGAARDHAFLLRMLRMEGAAEGGGRLVPDEEIVAAASEELETFIAKCHARGLLPGHVTVEHARETLDRLHAHRSALSRYDPQPLPVPVHLFPARQASHAGPSRGWDSVVPGVELRVTPVPGSHLSMMEPPNAESVGRALSEQLGEARRGGAAPRDEGASPAVNLRSGRAGVAPLFCVPGAGAGVTSFIDLTGSVDPSWPVYGLQPRGLDGAGVPHATVEAAAEYYLRAVQEACPRGPIHLLGHSFGGWVAFEMALRLREAGRAVGSLTILDSEVPGEDEARGESDGGEAFLKLVEIMELSTERSFGIAAADVASRDQDGWLKLLHQKMVQRGLVPARSTHEMLYGPFRTFARCLRTVYHPSGVYPDRLRLVLVSDPGKDENANREQFSRVADGWRRWAPGLELSTGEGNHISALKSPHTASLAAFLAADRR